MNIVFTCPGGPNYPWAGCSFTDGIGGSEGCLIRLASELAQLGNDVTVFNNCKEWAGIWGDVKYIDHSFYADSGIPDTADALISWRDWYQLLGRKAKMRLHSTHDIPVSCHHPNQVEMARPHENALEAVDKIIYLNNYHRGLSPWWPDEHSAVIPIGVEMPVEEVERNPAQVFYASHPHRGLAELRAVWPAVKAAVPEATLKSAWWEEAFFMPPNEQLGILPMFRTDQQGLVKLAQESGVYGYPCTFAAEISPAITIIAQLGGAYPVVIEQGGMIDTVQHGLKVNREQFAQELIEALHMSLNGDLDKARKEMSDWARETYSWKAVAIAWNDLIKSGVQ